LNNITDTLRRGLYYYTNKLNYTNKLDAAVDVCSCLGYLCLPSSI